MNTVRTWTICFNDSKTYSEIFLNTGWHFEFNWVWVWVWSLYCILRLTSIIFISVLSHSYHDVYFEVTLLIVQTIVVLNELSQVVPHKPIQMFKILHAENTIHAYTNNHYCCCCHYFAVFSFQVISFIVSLIQLSIWNKKVLLHRCS